MRTVKYLIRIIYSRVLSSVSVIGICTCGDIVFKSFTLRKMIKSQILYRLSLIELFTMIINQQIQKSSQD